MYRLRKRKLPFFIFIFLFATLCTLSFGQSTGPQLDLQLAPTLELAQVVYTSDFDFYQQGATTFLFQITLIGGNSPVDGLLVVEILQGDMILARAQTTSFRLLAGEPISASNIELSNGIITQSGDEIRLDEGQTSAPTDNFENEVLSGGKLPGVPISLLPTSAIIMVNRHLLNLSDLIFSIRHSSGQSILDSGLEVDPLILSILNFLHSSLKVILTPQLPWNPLFTSKYLKNWTNTIL